MAVMQGITELFPISSVGHGVIVPQLLGWHINQHAPTFLPFLVMLHLGTAGALFVFFWRDWVRLLWAPLADPKGKDPQVAEDRRLMSRIVVATLPAVVAGALLAKRLEPLYASLALTSLFLILNGLVLWVGEGMRHRGRVQLRELSPWAALAIGAAQAVALVPGFSRSGVTMVGGFLAGLSHESAARFAFLLATPIIFAAGVKEVPTLVHAGGHVLAVSALGGVAAGLAAYGSVWFLMRYFRRHEVEAMRPFLFYCVGVGMLGLVVAAVRAHGSF